jgi:hypothetical protein
MRRKGKKGALTEYDIPRVAKLMNVAHNLALDLAGALPVHLGAVTSLRQEHKHSALRADAFHNQSAAALQHAAWRELVAAVARRQLSIPDPAVQAPKQASRERGAVVGGPPGLDERQLVTLDVAIAHYVALCRLLIGRDEFGLQFLPLGAERSRPFYMGQVWVHRLISTGTTRPQTRTIITPDVSPTLSSGLAQLPRHSRNARADAALRDALHLQLARDDP